MKKNNEFNYDEADIEKDFDIKNAKFLPAKNKKISIIITNEIFNEAQLLSNKTGIGYQNTLKTAMAIGLQYLHNQIINIDK